jgi:uncharacterized protein YcaQ
MTLDDLRRFTAARSFFPPTTLARALRKMGYVQADPIRAPARAQDLILRHRVAGYRAGDLERRYARLGVAEDFFVNYGFVTRELQALMHPRPSPSSVAGGASSPATGARRWPTERVRRAALLLAFVRERGAVHPREVDAHFAHGKVKNYWGGTSNATTQLLDAMHYRGMLRVVRRDGGVRVYAAHDHGSGPLDETESFARLDALVDAVVRIYAPLPAASLAYYVRRLRLAAPQWAGLLTSALRRAKERLPRARLDGIDWFWPAGEDPARSEPADLVRLLAPFDPVVQDRLRFEKLWGWVYRFEAYTPAPKRKLGYYALPMLWRDRVLGWANVTFDGDRLSSQMGYVDARAARQRAFRRELDAELERMQRFLGESD